MKGAYYENSCYNPCHMAGPRCNPESYKKTYLKGGKTWPTKIPLVVVIIVIVKGKNDFSTKLTKGIGQAKTMKIPMMSTGIIE
jgi:hypothetical protein